MNINLLSLSSNKKSSHICVKYGSEDVYTAFNGTITLATYLNNRYLNVKDSEFVQLVTADIASFFKSATNTRVLVFPPFTSYYRLLTHKVVEEFSELSSFSIGEQNERRTVICFTISFLCVKKEIADQEFVPKSLAQLYHAHEMTQRQHDLYEFRKGLNENLGTDFNSSHLPCDTKKTGRRDNSPRSMDQTSSRNRQKRPDVQVYVPRARRLLQNSPGNAEITDKSSDPSDNSSFSSPHLQQFDNPQLDSDNQKDFYNPQQQDYHNASLLSKKSKHKTKTFQRTLKTDRTNDDYDYKSVTCDTTDVRDVTHRCEDIELQTEQRKQKHKSDPSKSADSRGLRQKRCDRSSSRSRKNAGEKSRSHKRKKDYAGIVPGRDQPYLPSNVLPCDSHQVDNLSSPLTSMKVETPPMNTDCMHGDESKDVCSFKNDISTEIVDGSVFFCSKAASNDTNISNTCSSVNVTDQNTIVCGTKTNLKCEVDHMESDVGHLEGEVSHIEGYVDHLEGGVGHLECEVDHLKCGVGHMEGEVDHLKCEVGHMEDEVDLLKCEVGHMEGEVDHLKCEVGHMEGEVDLLKCEVGHMEGEVGHLENQVGHLQNNPVMNDVFISDKKTNLSDSSAEVIDCLDHQTVMLENHPIKEDEHVSEVSQTQCSLSETEKLEIDACNQTVAMIKEINVSFTEELESVKSVNDEKSKDDQMVISEEIKNGAYPVENLPHISKREVEMVKSNLLSSDGEIGDQVGDNLDELKCAITQSVDLPPTSAQSRSDITCDQIGVTEMCTNLDISEQCDANDPPSDRPVIERLSDPTNTVSNVSQDQTHNSSEQSNMDLLEEGEIVDENIKCEPSDRLVPIAAIMQSTDLVCNNEQTETANGVESRKHMEVECNDEEIKTDRADEAMNIESDITRLATTTCLKSSVTPANCLEGDVSTLKTDVDQVATNMDCAADSLECTSNSKEDVLPDLNASCNDVPILKPDTSEKIENKVECVGVLAESHVDDEVSPPLASVAASKTKEKTPDITVADSKVDVDDEDTWDALFDDDGEALDDDLMNQLTEAVGTVEIQKAKFDYHNFQPKDPDMDFGAYGHLIEIYDFPERFITRDLLTIFKVYQDRGFDISWVDDTHAIGIFASTIAANSALDLQHPFLKVRPISMATRPTKMKAKKCSEFLKPYKERPETSASVARNLVAGALGLSKRINREKRDEDRRKLKDAKERKRKEVKDKSNAWSGSIGRCAMDEV